MNVATLIARLPGRITRGGQISIPAAVRHRWATDRILLEDRGAAVVIRPVPPDPIRAARGCMRPAEGMTSDAMRAGARAEDQRIDAARANRR